MSGVHTAYRKTTGTNFVEVQSTIILPTTIVYRENNPVSSGYNGAFPEFFHGFYKGDSYGLDAGILKKNGAYRLFFNSYPNTQSTGWFTSDPFDVGTSLSSRTFTLRSFFSNGYLCTRCYNSNNVEVAALDVYLTTAAYNSMSQGCTINRELTLAINADSLGNINIPANCYFSQTKIPNTLLTTASGAQVKMNLNNTTTQHGKLDPAMQINGVPDLLELHYDKRISVGVMEGDYVADVATATFNKDDYPVSEIV